MAVAHPASDRLRRLPPGSSPRRLYEKPRQSLKLSLRICNLSRPLRSIPTPSADKQHAESLPPRIPPVTAASDVCGPPSRPFPAPAAAIRPGE